MDLDSSAQSCGYEGQQYSPALDREHKALVGRARRVRFVNQGTVIVRHADPSLMLAFHRFPLFFLKFLKTDISKTLDFDAAYRSRRCRVRGRLMQVDMRVSTALPGRGGEVHLPLGLGRHYLFAPAGRPRSRSPQLPAEDL